MARRFANRFKFRDQPALPGKPVTGSTDFKCEPGGRSLVQKRARLLKVLKQRRFDIVSFCNEHPIARSRQPVDSGCGSFAATLPRLLRRAALWRKTGSGVRAGCDSVERIIFYNLASTHLQVRIRSQSRSSTVAAASRPCFRHQCWYPAFSRSASAAVSA